jgi:hypothetical protein
MFKSIFNRWTKEKVQLVGTFAIAVGIASLSFAAGARILATAVALDIVLNIKN